MMSDIENYDLLNTSVQHKYPQYFYVIITMTLLLSFGHQV